MPLGTSTFDDFAVCLQSVTLCERRCVEMHDPGGFCGDRRGMAAVTWGNDTSAAACSHPGHHILIFSGRATRENKIPNACENASRYGGCSRQRSPASFATR